VIAGQHASCAMWRPPWRTRSSRNPRQPRWRDLRCGARAAPRTHPHRRLDWQRPFRDERAMPFTRAVPPRLGAALQGWPKPVRECVGEELERRLRRDGDVRGLDQAREMGRARAIGMKRGRRWRVARATGCRATRQGVAARGGQCRRRITPGLRRARGKGLAPWSGHGPRCY
jgi:hypothetical protein